MKSFRDILDQKLSDEEENRFLTKIISEIEALENNPFDNFNATVVNSKQNESIYVAYDILNEERSFVIKSQPSEDITIDEPSTTEKNININDYRLEPKGFCNHEERLIVPNSSFISTCTLCNGDGVNDCYSCSASGKCSKCIGSGEVRCRCGNGNCSNCAGRGELTCTGPRCSMGRCTECSGTGRRTEAGKSESCRRCIGSGRCNSCNGKGVKKCNDCTGSGKHSECRGSGKNPCKSCAGKGRCKQCFGKGKITCSKCEGKKYLLNDLEIVSSFSHLNDSISLIRDEINPNREIKLDEIFVQQNLYNENSSKSFSKDELDSFSEIEEIIDFVKNRYESCDSELKILERIQFYKIPVITINFVFENKEYVSYFVGSNEEHFIKTSPILDYSAKVEETISNLIQETNYSEAIRLLDEQQIRYSSVGDIEKSNSCKSSIESLRIKVQKDLVRGGLIAQFGNALLDIFVLYYLIFNCLTPTKKDINSLFIVTTVSFLLVRFGYYIKYLAPITILKNNNPIEVNKILNGDERASYYFVDQNGLKWLRIIGTFGLFVTFFSSYGKNTVEPYVSFIFIFSVAFTLSIFTTIFLDLNYNRKISNEIENLSNSRSRLARAFLKSTFIGVLSTTMILFLGSFLINPDVDFNAISASTGLQNVSLILFIIVSSVLVLLLLTRKSSNNQKRKIRVIFKYFLISSVAIGLGYFIVKFFVNKNINNELNRIESKVSKPLPKKNIEQEIDNVNEVSEEKNEIEIYFQDLLGDYSGKFGNNKIVIHIEEIDSIDYYASGWNLVGSNKRSISGTLSKTNNYFIFSLNEPGDDKYDGVFEFKIYMNSINSLEGTWNSNDGKLSRDFILTRL
jgi:hypothetical protein